MTDIQASEPTSTSPEQLDALAARVRSAGRHQSIPLLVFGAIAALILPLNFLGKTLGFFTPIAIFAALAWAVFMPAGFLTTWLILRKQEADRGVSVGTAKYGWMALATLLTSFLASIGLTYIGGPSIYFGFAMLVVAAIRQDMFLIYISVTSIVLGIVTIVAGFAMLSGVAVALVVAFPVLLLVAGVVAWKRENPIAA